MFAKNPLAFWRDRDRTSAGDAAYPARGKAVCANRRPDLAGKMRPPFAPIEAWPTEDAGRALAALRHQSIDVNADVGEKRDAPIGDQSTIARQLDIFAANQCVGERYAEPAGEVVVARPGEP